MPYLPTNRHYTYRSGESGLTLIEMLVVAPLIILLIGALVIAISNLTGSSLFSQEKNNAAYNVQSALDDMDTSVRYATKFLSTTGTLTSPQGKNNSTTAFTHDSTTDTYDTLIFTSAATDKSIYDSTRQLVYQGAGACNATNPVYQYTTVYFVDPTTKALYKRTILPTPGALCRSVSQKNSCATVSGTLCVTRDEKLLDNVKSVKIEYLANPSSSTTTTPDLAQVAVITITRSTVGGGEDVDYSGTLRVSRLNVNSINDSATVANPAVTGLEGGSSNAGNSSYSWPASNNATGYNITYRIDGGAWQNGPQNTTQTSYTVSGLYRKQTAEVRVQAITPNGNFYYDTGTTTVPNWYDCTFSGQGQWNNYGAWYGGGPYTTAGFTKTSSKIVGLKGLVKGTTLNVPICTLPVGFRPKFAGEKLIFQVASGNGANWGRIDVFPNGDVVPVQGNTEWFSLDGIMFIADDSSYTWTTRSWQNSWNNYGPGHATLRSTTDTQGRVHVQGLGSYPGTSPNVIMTSGLSGAGSGTLHIPAMSGGPGIIQVTNIGQVLSRSSPTSYQSLQFMYRPSSAGWQNMPFSSGWTNYNNGFPTMRCHRGSDDIVVVQGLIRHPGGGNNTYIGDTGPCGRFSSGKGIGVEDRLLLSPWTSNEAPGRIDMINGVSLLSQGTADGWTALDGIHFIAD